MPDSTLGFTLEEAVSTVQIMIGNDSSPFATHLYNVANLAQMEICNVHDWSFLHTTGSVVITANTNTGTLPADCMSIESVVDASNGAKIQKTEARDLDKFDPESDDKGDVTHYAEWEAGSIIVYPKPESNTTLAVKYKKRVAWITTGQYPTIPIQYQHVWLQLMFANGMRHESDDRYAQEYTTYKSMLMDAMRSDHNKLEDNSRMRWPDEEDCSVTTGQTYGRWLRSVYGD